MSKSQPPPYEGPARFLLQITIDEDFASGKITHQEWSDKFDHLSSNLWKLPFPPPMSHLPIIG